MPTETHRPRSASAFRVVLVDDDRILLRSVARALRAARPDWEVVPVASGLQAVRELSLRGCDVLVTDLQMPVMSGAALVLRTRQEFPHVPVIVHSTMVDLGAGTSVGVPVDVAVPKSRGAAALVDAIEHLERSRIHQAAS